MSKTFACVVKSATCKFYKGWTPELTQFVGTCGVISHSCSEPRLWRRELGDTAHVNAASKTSDHIFDF